ncbi:hypothetical protein GCM10023172_06590 [Hymenobacter ginsengisoli]|uniref:DUF2069 domain-containing protein n=1 Tax=Hymenobacter ginsengisoli TaxID=1051626 RepID=A0ABP8PZD8_9BACT|nr:MULTISPECIES: hypothetical protein [unclassified Hymenobacter]MBO2032692.1 hypothetical protein [Hymenobacter sp. BT559]
MPRPTTPRALPRPKRLSALGRGLAAAQLLKETLTIVLLGVPLLLAQPLLVPAVLPGLVLYLCHWVIMAGRIPRRSVARIWFFTLLDELWGLALYLHAYDAPTARQLRYLKWSVGLGLVFTLTALAEVAYRRYRERRGLRRALLGASLR